MAHAIFSSETARRGLEIGNLSAGLANFDGVSVAREARLTCEKNKTPLPKFIASYIGNVDLTGVTRVFVMEHSHVPLLLKLTSLSPDRISLLGEFDPEQRGAEIDDPIGQDIVAFEACYERLRDCILHYLDTSDEYRREGGSQKR
jgi:protein-tyrosine-phosphatase